MPRTTARHTARSALTALLALALVLVGGPSASAATAEESAFVQKINDARASSGVGPVGVAADLTEVARAHSARMAAENRLYHNPSLASEVSNWRSLAENVGYGGGVDAIHAALMNSAGHRANILNGAFREVGVGVVVSGGRTWVTQVFRDPVPGTTTAVAPSTAGRRAPIGSVDSVARVPGSLRVAGWSLDPDGTATVELHVYVDGRLAAITKADGSRPDVGQAYPSHGSSRGYTAQFPVSGSGSREVCVFAIDVERAVPNPALGCRRVGVSPMPFGSLDGVGRVPGGLDVAGWGIDPDTTSPIGVHLYVDGRYAGQVTAQGARPDVGRAFPDYGSAHGYGTRIAVAGGRREVCAYGIDHAGGFNPQLGCRSVDVQDRPIGSLDSATVVGSGVRMSGWTLDPDTADSLEVHLYVGPRGVPARAAGTREDVARVYPAYGAQRGYDAVAPAPGPGTWQACAYGINRLGGTNSLLGCRTVTVP